MQRGVKIRRVVAPVIAGALLLLPQTAVAQKNIKVGLTLGQGQTRRRVHQWHV